MKEREAKLPATSKGRLTQTVQLLLSLYEATGDGEQVVAWRQRLDEGKTNKKQRLR
jgi:hypothetical protein